MSGGGQEGALQGPLALKTKLKTKSCTILLTNNGHLEALKWFRNGGLGSKTETGMKRDHE